MISHRPAGRGHPYRVEPDQRVPVRPSAGEAFELRATTRAGARGVQVELDRNGQRHLVPAYQRSSSAPEDIGDWGVPAPRVSQGHLSEVMDECDDDASVSWSVGVEPLAYGETLRYRLQDDDEATPWHEMRGCALRASGGTLGIDDADGAIARMVDGRSAG